MINLLLTFRSTDSLEEFPLEELAKERKDRLAQKRTAVQKE